MPTYVYEHVEPAPSCSNGPERFEIVQPITAEALTACPRCGAAVRRVPSAPAIHGASSSGATLSNKNLAEKGFTKYVKAGDGHYEKAAGKGPDVLRR